MNGKRIILKNTGYQMEGGSMFLVLSKNQHPLNTVF